LHLANSVNVSVLCCGSEISADLIAIMEFEANLWIY